MKTFRQLLEDWRQKMSERDKAFEELANQQRGKPESAMLDLARTAGGGVYSHAVEHIGDLTHRMSQYVTSYNRGFEFVKPKVLNMYRSLHHPYGFEKEHIENMESNAEYNGKPRGEHLANVARAADRYADEHSKLKVYNDVQHHARQAAVELGRRNWNAARHHISVLKDHIDKGEEHWTKVASEYNPNYQGPK